jgi:hypothetical protein
MLYEDAIGTPFLIVNLKFKRDCFIDAIQDGTSDECVVTNEP